MSEPSLFAPPEPLAARLRPRTIDEVVGQTHLLAPGRPACPAVAVEHEARPRRPRLGAQELLVDLAAGAGARLALLDQRRETVETFAADLETLRLRGGGWWQKAWHAAHGSLETIEFLQVLTYSSQPQPLNATLP